MSHFIYAGIYFLAIPATLWPMLMLAVGSGFAGTGKDALTFVIPFAAEITAVALLALGGSALMARRTLPLKLLLSGPTLSLITVVFLAGYVFHDSVGLLSLTLPQAAFAIAALVAGVGSSKAEALTGRSTE